jgi:hypothetical protein
MYCLNECSGVHLEESSDVSAVRSAPARRLHERLLLLLLLLLSALHSPLPLGTPPPKILHSINLMNIYIINNSARDQEERNPEIQHLPYPRTPTATLATNSKDVHLYPPHSCIHSSILFYFQKESIR